MAVRPRTSTASRAATLRTDPKATPNRGCTASAAKQLRCRAIHVTPHVAQSTKRNGGSAINARITRHLGYEVGPRERKRIEQRFGSGLVIRSLRQLMVQGFANVDQLLTLIVDAYNLTRPVHLGATPSAVRSIAQRTSKWPILIA